MSEERDQEREQSFDAIFDEKGFVPSKTPNGSVFDPETGEVSFQTLGDECV